VLDIADAAFHMLLPSPRGNSCQGSLYLKKKELFGDEIPVTALYPKNIHQGRSIPTLI